MRSTKTGRREDRATLNLDAALADADQGKRARFVDHPLQTFDALLALAVAR